MRTAGERGPDWPWIVAAVAIGIVIVLVGGFAVHAAEASPIVCGEASWYGPESGNRTATGDYFDGRSLTAAMPSRAWLGHIVRVTNERNGRSLTVLINDLGPAAWTHRVIDLSRAAAEAIGMPGTAPVCLSGASP